jgi:hypothetical protein
MASTRNQFAVFEHPMRGLKAIPVGFSWLGAVLPSVWLLLNGFYASGALLLAVDAVKVFLVVKEGGLLAAVIVARLLLGLIVGIAVGRRAAAWAANALEGRGYVFKGITEAVSAGSACSLVKAGSASLVTDRSRLVSRRFSFVPKSWQAVLAIAGLTWKAALRFRLFWVMLGLLLLCVTALPLLVRDDGTARGFIQIMLTYTLSLITTLLGFATLWTACGTLAKDIEENQMQMVVTKPVARWQVWFGKWLGLVALNAVLLSVAGTSVYFLLMYRAGRLPAEQQKVLRDEILVARGSLRPEVPDLREFTDTITKERLKNVVAGTQLDVKLVRQQVEEQLKAELQIVRPNSVKPWRIDLGFLAGRFNDEQFHVRVKFNVAQTNESGLYVGSWVIGPPDTDKVRATTKSFSADNHHEFAIPKNMADDKGILTLQFYNQSDTTLLFPLEDGLELLYQEGGFGLNFARGLGIIFCWLALFAAVGLAAGSFLSFPVASLAAVAIFFVGLSSGTLKSVVEDGTFLGTDHESGKPISETFDMVMVPLFKGLLTLVNFSQDFSPVDSLSTGRSITWGALGLAGFQVVVLTGGVFAAFGIWAFHRRELAATQATS